MSYLGDAGRLPPGAVIAPQVVIVEGNEAFADRHYARTGCVKRDCGNLAAVGAGSAERLLHGHDQCIHVVRMLLCRVIGIFLFTDERILRDAGSQPPLPMVEDRDPDAQCAEIYASNDAHMRHDILLSKHKQRVPRGHRYPLLPVTQKTDWIRLHRTARRKSPERLAAGCMQGEEVAFVRATKNETACSREQARPRRRMERKFPCLVSRGDFERAPRAPRFQSGNAAETAGAEKVAGMV